MSIDTSKSTPELFAALAKAQGEVENASKSSSNPHFRSKYADLAEVLNTVRPVFSKHGLSIVQSTAFNGSLVTVCTVIAHGGGGLISSEASCVPAKHDAQGVGAATTYLRRYSLAAMAGIAQEDDDGNAAAHTNKAAPNVSAYAAVIAKTTPAKALEMIKSWNMTKEEKAALWAMLPEETRNQLDQAAKA